MLPLYVLRRLLAFPFILVGLSTVIFVLLYLLPGDPARLMAGQGATNEVVESIRHEMGLDDPLLVQYSRYLAKIAQGDFGRSFQSHRLVAEDIGTVYPKTMQLAFAAEALALVAGVMLGLLATVARQRWANVVLLGISVASLSLPLFWLALILQIVLALQLGLLPPSGYSQGLDRYILLPALTLALPTAGYLARITHSALAQLRQADFMRTAYAKGANESRAVLRHLLPNALIPIISVAGTDLSRLLAGILIVENIFAWPGIGKYAYDALVHRDMPALQGAVLVFGATVLLVNLVVDVLYTLSNPQIRYGA